MNSIRSEKKEYRASCLLAVLLMAILVLSRPMTVQAKGSAQITECRFRSTSTLKVVASCDPAAVSGKYCYVFALPFAGGKPSSGDKPLAKKIKAPVMSFSVRVPRSLRQEYLYSRFVIAEKKKNRYRIISPGCYITNPDKTAKLRYAFPQASSKKGLQVAASMVEDAVDLNVQHSVLNIDLARVLAGSSKHNSRQGIPFEYCGKTYWMDRETIEGYDRQLRTLKVSNTVVSAVLLLSYNKSRAGLVHPKARRSGYPYYAWNLTSEKARQTFRAILSFLAQRYCARDAAYGRIVNWIVGNEVESPAHWNYSGGMSLGPYIAQYARQFRMVYTSVTSVYANARVYISLSHLWNDNPIDSFTARETLEAFASAISAQGNIPWNLAYHPYSSPLTEPRFWENRNGLLTAAITSPVINMGNLSVLTTYIKNTYGPSTRIILSEQGFTSVQDRKNVQAEQSAAIAYSYLLTEADDMVDSFIMNRHVDHKVEVKQGLNLGLWTTSGVEWADEKKSSWALFKYMDTSLSEKFTNAALSVIDVKQWSDVIANYSPVLYEKVNLIEGNLQIVGGYRQAGKIADKWEAYGAAVKFSRKKNEYTTAHDGSRNRNCQWGFIQTFKKRLNMSAHPVFCTRLTLTGSQARNVLVKMRFYSGRNEYELTQVIPRGKRVALRADLSGWAFSGRISRIMITLEPIQGGWKNHAKLTMTRPVMGNR